MLRKIGRDVAWGCGSGGRPGNDEKKQVNVSVPSSGSFGLTNSHQNGVRKKLMNFKAIHV